MSSQNQYGLLGSLVDYGLKLSKDYESARKVARNLTSVGIGVLESAYNKLSSSYEEGRLGEGLKEVYGTLKKMYKSSCNGLQAAEQLMGDDLTPKQIARLTDLLEQQQRDIYGELL